MTNKISLRDAMEHIYDMFIADETQSVIEDGYLTVYDLQNKPLLRVNLKTVETNQEYSQENYDDLTIDIQENWK